MRYETRGVLAGAYKAGRESLTNLRTHTVRIENGVEAALCRRVRDENICDAGAYTRAELDAAPTCPVCLKRDPRFTETT